jgi:small GTP-binding protein
VLDARVRTFEAITLNMRTVKCTIVGSPTVGKTVLLMTYNNGHFPSDYIHCAINDYSSNVMVDGETITFTVWDPISQDEYDRPRLYSYANTNIFLVCFSLVYPYSFERVRTHWLPDISQFAPKVPFILVGTQLDLRQDPKTIKELRERNMTPISYAQGLQMAQ